MQKLFSSLSISDIFLVMVLSLGVFVQAADALGRKTQNEIGMNTHIPSAVSLDLLVEMGSRWIRVDNNWNMHTDPCSENIEFFPGLNNAIYAAADRDIQVFMTLAFSPLCGAVDPNNPDYGPRADRYADYVRRSVAHYRALGVRHFGLWNEPSNLFGGDTAQLIDNVYVAGIPAVQEGCLEAGFDDCLVLGPELSRGNIDKLPQIVDTLRTHGLAFDIITHHIYGDFSEYFGLFEDALSDAGLMRADGKALVEYWITETGAGAELGTHGRACDEVFGYFDCLFGGGQSTMDTQTNYVMNAIEEQLRHDAWTKTFFYELVEDPRFAPYGFTVYNENGQFERKDVFNRVKSNLQVATSLGLYPSPIQCGILNSGQGLFPGESLTSCNGAYSLMLQEDGNLVLYASGIALWSSHTWGIGAGAAVMQGDGNFVLYSELGTSPWVTSTDGNDGAVLAVQDDGNLVVYSNTWAALWASHTAIMR